MGLLGSGSAHMAGRAGRALPNTTQDKQNVRCQRCLQMGHYTFECKNEPAYQSRPSRTQQLKNPKLYKQRFLDASELPEELRPKPPPVAAPPKPSKEERKKKKKKKQESSSEDSSSSSSSSSDDSSSDSDSSSSDSSSSDSDSDSSSDDSSSSSSSSSSSDDSSSGSSSSDDDSGSSTSSSDDDSGSSSSDSDSDSSSDEDKRPRSRGSKHTKKKADRGKGAAGKDNGHSQQPLRTEADRRSMEKVQQAMAEDQPNYAGGARFLLRRGSRRLMCAAAGQKI